jgi:hypothetical protein
MELKPPPPAHLTRLNAQGLIEVIDLYTNRVICVQSSHRDLLDSKWDQLVKIDTPQGPVWIEKGINFDYVKHCKYVPYSKHLGDLICQAIVNGADMMGAARTINLEYADICRWRRESKDFASALEVARRDRAELLHDRAIKTAQSSCDAKLQVETDKWAAEKGDPEKFGNKTKIVGDAAAPIVLAFETGIRRRGDSGFTEPQEEVRDVTKTAGVLESDAGGGAGVPSLDPGSKVPEY